MVLIPGDTDYINLLRRIRQEIAQDRTDIQRLMRVMRRAEFLEFPIPEVDAVGEASSSASASASMSEESSSCIECVGCTFPTSGLTATVSQSGTCDTSFSTEVSYYWFANTGYCLLGSNSQTDFFCQPSGTVRFHIRFKKTGCTFYKGNIAPFGDFYSNCQQVSLFCVISGGVSTLQLWMYEHTDSDCVSGSGVLTNAWKFTIEEITCDPLYIRGTKTLTKISPAASCTTTIEITE